MTVATAQISESLQTLIDSRLDTIDRMLLGRLSRQDRLAIVREVESQIHELLQERDADELTREDVLAVLARLDPPEAYIPDETEGEPVSLHQTIRGTDRSTSDQGRRQGRPSQRHLGLGGDRACYCSCRRVTSIARRAAIRDCALLVLGGGNLLVSR